MIQTFLSQLRYISDLGFYRYMRLHSQGVYVLYYKSELTTSLVRVTYKYMDGRLVIPRELLTHPNGTVIRL